MIVLRPEDQEISVAETRRLIGRKEAVASGLKHYFTGKPCKRGHVAKRTVGDRQCVECASITAKEYQLRNPGAGTRAAKRHAEKYPERIKAAQDRYRMSDHGKAKRAEQARRVRSTPHGSLNNRMSCGIRNGLQNGGKAGKRWADLVGYSIEDLKHHLERQFLKGMSWSNFGEWHVDHIIPLSSFSFSSPCDPEFKKAWDLPNLRPLWGIDNIKKKAKVLTLL